MYINYALYILYIHILQSIGIGRKTIITKSLNFYAITLEAFVFYYADEISVSRSVLDVINHRSLFVIAE